MVYSSLFTNVVHVSVLAFPKKKMHHFSYPFVVASSWLIFLLYELEFSQFNRKGQLDPREVMILVESITKHDR